MVRKVIISIFILIASISVNGQGNFFFNQHFEETTCEYGDINDYTLLSIWYSSNNGYIETLQEAKDIIDCIRDINCQVSLSGSNNYAYRSFTVNDYILNVSSGIIQCTLSPGFETYTIVFPFDGSGNSIIMKFEDGIITYIEYY